MVDAKLKSEEGAAGSEFGPADEYKTLREELLQAKKYVFERPILIVAAALAGLGAVGGEYMALLLPLVAALLLFNFWFTVNRLFSAARIVAYIQVELEQRRYGRWVGWETCLREYRRWLKQRACVKEDAIDADIDSDAVPDALMYYPPIYGLHIGLMSATLLAAGMLAARDRAWISVVCGLLTLFLTGWFALYLRRCRPKALRRSIEWNRGVWHEVFNTMMREERKPG